MEGEYNAILDWRSSTSSVPPGATTQWGSSIVISGQAKRIHGSKRKSFMADMYGFASDGELQAIKAYLLSHGNFEIEQVTLQGGFYYSSVWAIDQVDYSTFGYSTVACYQPHLVACYL